MISLCLVTTSPLFCQTKAKFFPGYFRMACVSDPPNVFLDLSRFITSATLSPRMVSVQTQIRLQHFPAPTTRTAICSFLGLAGYYRHFVKDFASIAHPLLAFTSDAVPFSSTPVYTVAFQSLQEALMTVHFGHVRPVPALFPAHRCFPSLPWYHLVPRPWSGQTCTPATPCPRQR